MDKTKTKRFLLTLAAAYWLLVGMIYAVAQEQFHYRLVTSDTLPAVGNIGEVRDDWTVTQRLTAPAEQLTSLDLLAATYARTNTGRLSLRLDDSRGETAVMQTVDMALLHDGAYTTITLDAPIVTHKGEAFTLTLTTEGCDAGNTVSLYFGNTVSAGRFDIPQSIAPEDRYAVNGTPGVGKLCVRFNGVQTLSFYKTYWLIVSGAFLLACGYTVYALRKARNGRNSPLLSAYTLYARYGFLLKQLVGRDFKTKYKRSALGMAWSFLNPLLTMAVQYVVFSTLFKSNTQNYPVYLLSGIVFFNFFNEAVSMGMTSITGNGSLIKKVYMPKYIYPFSRLVSSLINLGLALIPLLLVMLLTGTWPRPSMLLLVFDVLCLLGFVLGMMLLLSTSMTFFQDTQFLWGVLSMLWMYMTPIFYPESIIPQRFLTLYHMNPMYQYITFARICIIDGVSPEPMAYLWCILSSVVVLMLGAWVFKKQQDQFVLYL